MGDDASHCISSALEDWLHDYLWDVAGATILELGSGAGTGRLSKHWRMISIEHDDRFVGRHPSTYIHAPIQPFKKQCAVFPDDAGWYDRDILRAELPKHRYDLILVDGPPNYIGRGGFYKWKDLFHLNVPLVFDDAHRPAVIKILQRLSAHLKRPYTVHGCWSDRHFGVILP